MRNSITVDDWSSFWTLDMTLQPCWSVYSSNSLTVRLTRENRAQKPLSKSPSEGESDSRSCECENLATSTKTTPRRSCRTLQSVHRRNVCVQYGVFNYPKSSKLLNRYYSEISSLLCRRWRVALISVIDTCGAVRNEQSSKENATICSASCICFLKTGLLGFHFILRKCEHSQQADGVNSSAPKPSQNWKWSYAS